MTDLVHELNSQTENTAGPLVFFIDELDRCKPTYAIKLLERLKHLFSTEGIVFVLSIDKRQLSSSIKTLYGADIDSEGYLRRFIDLEFKLPEPAPLDYPRFLYTVSGIDDIVKNKKFKDEQAIHNQIIETFTVLVTAFNLKLRDQEKCFNLLKLAIYSTSDGDNLHALFLVLLVALKIYDQGLYEKLKRNENIDNAAAYTAVLKKINIMNNRRPPHRDSIENRKKIEIEFDALKTLHKYPNLIIKMCKRIDILTGFSVES